jgi:hypothetical protein
VIAGRRRGINVMRRRGRGQRVGAHSHERKGAVQTCVGKRRCLEECGTGVREVF